MVYIWGANRNLSWIASPMIMNSKNPTRTKSNNILLKINKTNRKLFQSQNKINTNCNKNIMKYNRAGIICPIRLNIYIF